MYSKNNEEDRLTIWYNLRKEIETSNDPFNLVAEFWGSVPQIVHNTLIDPYYPKSWPTPWDIIHRNKFDDFTLAIMMGYTIKLTNRFNKDKIEVKTMIDSDKKQLYNLVYINEDDVLNYIKNIAVKNKDIKENLYVENVVEIFFPR